MEDMVSGSATLILLNVSSACIIMIVWPSEVPTVSLAATATWCSSPSLPLEGVLEDGVAAAGKQFETSINITREC